MRIKTSIWFEVGISFPQTQENGSPKNVTEKYAVDAMSFTEAESVVINEIATCISGELTIKSEAQAPYKEVFFSEASKEDNWYKAKLQFITFPEKTGKEKRSNTVYLVQGSSMGSALKNIDAVMGGPCIDYEVISLAKTRIVDVLEHTEVKTTK